MQTSDLLREYGPVAHANPLEFALLAARLGVPERFNRDFVEALREKQSGTFGNRHYRRNRNWKDIEHTLGYQAALRDGRDPLTEWEHTRNIVTNEGLAEVLDVFLKNATWGAWYVTLSSTNTTEDATMTAATPQFTEIDATDVTETIRETWTGGAITGTTTASVDNSASVATYTCDVAGFTAYAAALIGGTGGSSALGNTGGTLYSYSLFASSKTLASTDTLDVTYTFTATSA